MNIVALISLALGLFIKGSNASVVSLLIIAVIAFFAG